MKTITIMSHDRPKYLREVLLSLIRNDLTDWTVVIGQNPTNKAQQCIKLFCDLLEGRCDIQLHIPKQSRDIRYNPFYLQEFVYEKLKTELNILLEDDTPVSNDICDLALAYQKLPDPRLMLLYNRHGPKEAQGPIDFIRKQPYYTENLAHACLPQNWDRYLKRWWFDNKHGLNGIGYDFSLHGLSKKEGIGTYQVAHSRVTHIGLDGVHTKSHEHRPAQAIFSAFTPPNVDKPVTYRFEP